MSVLSQTDLDYIRTLVRRRSAIVLEPDKNYLIETRLTPLAQREGLASLQELIASLRANRIDDLQHRVVEAITTHETSFFRDIHPFEALRTVVLPELIARRPNQSLTVWCAACSSGQEPYSLAMLAHQHFPDLARGRLRIIATDLSDAILARARDGLFSQIEVNRGLPAALLAKYFTRQGLYWKIMPEIRRMVEFRQHNLATAWPTLPALDLVLLRNVLIYFCVDTKKTILAKVRCVLKPDGYLFLGASETTVNLDAAFEAITFERTVCYRSRPKPLP
jgi:chemotaxis protein methyltransferase CheR